MLEILANSNLMRRFLQVVAVMPVVVHFVTQAEKLALPGPDKKAKVLTAVEMIVSNLVGNGILPSDAPEGLMKTASSLVDSVVGVHNAVGFFQHSDNAPAEIKPITPAPVA